MLNFFIMEKHIYSIQLFAVLEKLPNGSYKVLECRKAGDALETEVRLRQHENAITQRFKNMLDIPIPGKRDYELHEILKKDPRIQWDGETDQGYFTGREVFYMKNPAENISYIDQKILDWATGKIQPVDDYTRRQNWFKEFGFNPSRIQRRIINIISNRFERAIYTKGKAINKLKHLLEAVPRSGKSVMSLYIAKKMGFKRILIITPFPDADGSFREIIEFHPDFPNGKFSDARLDFKNGCQVKFDDQYNDMQIIMMSWQNLDEEKEKFQELFNSKIDFIIVDETHRQSDSKRSDSILNRFYEKNLHLPILHLSGTPYNDKISGRFISSETTTYDFLDKWRDVLEARNKLFLNKFREEERKELEYIASFPNIKLILVEKIRQAFEQAQMEYPFDKNAPIDVFFSDKKYKIARRFFFEGLAPRKNFTNISLMNNTLLSGKYSDEFNHIMIFLENNEVTDMIKLELEELTININSGWNGYSILCISGREEKDDYKNLEKDINEFQKNNPKTIILSVGKATTGLTIKRLSSIWIMRKMRSAELFMQILFRLGTPFNSKENVNAVVFDSEAVITAQVTIAKARSSAKKESLIKVVREMNEYIPLILYDGIEYVKIDPENILSFSREIAQRKIAKLSEQDYHFKNIEDLKELCLLAGVDIKKLDKDIGVGGQEECSKFRIVQGNTNYNKQKIDQGSKELKEIKEGIEYLLNHMDWIIRSFEEDKINTIRDIYNLSNEDFLKIRPFIVGKKKYTLTKKTWKALINSVDNHILQDSINQAKIKFMEFSNF